MPHLFLSLAAAAGLAVAPADSVELRREALMEALQSGGYSILLRHARTDRSFNEQRDPVPTERKDQRNLNDDGVHDAKLMGVVFRKYGIPLGEIISSPMYRALETAEMAAGKPTTNTMALRVFPSTPEQAALVATPPRPGTNRLLVTHHFVIETHVPGIKPGDIGESEAAVVRHTANGKVELVGKILLDDWAALADSGQSTPAGSRQEGHGIHEALARVLHGSPDGNGTKRAEIPDTHAGHIAREYIAAFNSGSADTMKAFIESWMVQDPNRPTAERLSTYSKLFAEHGALALTSVEESQALSVTLGMKSRRGNFRLNVRSSEAQPMRAASVTFAMLEGAHR
jgi:phosphohistidine phosphatase SixA